MKYSSDSIFMYLTHENLEICGVIDREIIIQHEIWMP